MPNPIVGHPKSAIETPAFLVDLDKLKHNIKMMADYFRDRPAKLRPHWKTPKTVEIAKMQLEAGAIGINLNLQGGQHGLRVRLDDLPQDRWSTVLVPLPGEPAAWKPLDQLQLQGGNFSAAAKPLKLAIDRIGTTRPPEGWKP